MGFELEVSEILQEQFEQKLEMIRARVAAKAAKTCMRTTKTHSLYHLSNSLDFLKQTPQFFAIAF